MEHGLKSAQVSVAAACGLSSHGCGILLDQGDSLPTEILYHYRLFTTEPPGNPPAQIFKSGCLGLFVVELYVFTIYFGY